MCASYMIKQRNPDRLGIATEIRIDDFEQFADQVIVPHRLAPVIRRDGDVIILTAMKFSLLPSWSKEPKVKFATHNARLETIHEKPTWRKVFVTRHCLIPITDFIEPIYEGEFSGHMVAFHQPDHGVLLAAGVWDEWVNKESGEVVNSFSIITQDPLPYVASVGHDRSPVFITSEAAPIWLKNEGQEPKALQQFLREAQKPFELVAQSHRIMKSAKR